MSWQCFCGQMNADRYCSQCGMPKSIWLKLHDDRILNLVAGIAIPCVIGVLLTISISKHNTSEATLSVGPTASRSKPERARIIPEVTEFNQNAHTGESPISVKRGTLFVDSSPENGCDPERQTKVLRYAFEKALPAEPPHETAEIHVSAMNATTLLLVNPKGEPDIVRDENLMAPDPGVCAYSDDEVSVYLPSSTFTNQVPEFVSGPRKAGALLSMPMPDSRFGVISYWYFKRPRSREFSWGREPNRATYEARQVLFDVAMKAALFSSDVLADANGNIIGKLDGHQRMDLRLDRNRKALRIFTAMADIINRSELKFETVWRSLH